jgi:hypothetical protein
MAFQSTSLLSLEGERMVVNDLGFVVVSKLMVYLRYLRYIYYL